MKANWTLVPVEICLSAECWMLSVFVPSPPPHLTVNMGSVWWTFWVNLSINLWWNVWKKVSPTCQSLQVPMPLNFLKYSLWNAFVVFDTCKFPFFQTTSSALKGAIQLGITHTIGSLSQKPERDVLLQDFEVVESIFFPWSVCNDSL